MRTLLYETLKARLTGMGDILHIALWNQQVTFLEEEEPFELPAVFIEFAPLEWTFKDKSLTDGWTLLCTDARLTLHVLTPATWTDAQTLTFLDNFPGRLAGLEAEGENIVSFERFMHVASTTNHDHGEIIESLETFAFRAYKTY